MTVDDGGAESLFLYRAFTPGCADSCQIDVDNSGDIGFGDLLRTLAYWGPCFNCCEDTDGNGQVDFDDLLAILTAWGPCPAP